MLHIFFKLGLHVTHSQMPKAWEKGCLLSGWVSVWLICFVLRSFCQILDWLLWSMGKSVSSLHFGFLHPVSTCPTHPLSCAQMTTASACLTAELMWVFILCEKLCLIFPKTKPQKTNIYSYRPETDWVKFLPIHSTSQPAQACNGTLNEPVGLQEKPEEHYNIITCNLI